MSKSDKLGVDKLLKRVTGEFEKAQQRVETMVSDALSRIDGLQNQVQELRETVKDRVGLGESDSASTSKSKAKSGGAAKGATPAAKKQSTGQSKSTKGTKAASATKTTKSAPKAKNDSDLTRVKGIGPATADKMRAKGITSIKQIANPSAEDKKKLEDFSHLKSFSSWQAEAKKLV